MSDLDKAIEGKRIWDAHLADAWLRYLIREYRKQAAQPWPTRGPDLKDQSNG